MDVAERTKAYREGFREGANAMLQAIGDDLPEQQRSILSKWVAGALQAWRDSPPDDPQPPAPLIDGA